jgi:hypothetical protein
MCGVHAGYKDVIVSKHRIANLNPVSYIRLHSNPDSSSIDAIVVGFTNGDEETLGSPDAELAGAEVASVRLAPNDKVTALYVWTNSTQMRVQGIQIKMSSGIRLNGAQGRLPTQASLRLDKPGDLGSGLLLGVVGSAKPGSEVLSAVGFSFLQLPMSSAIAVDMPSIAIEEVVFTPQVSIQSSTR